MESVLFVAGARPNFMKVAPLLRAARAPEVGFTSELVHTGQHYDFAMSGVFFDQLGIAAPAVHLAVGSADVDRLTAAFEAHLRARVAPPAAIVVVGDVNSTLAAAIAGTRCGIRVVHVEAGLRSFDAAMPEERNRVETDALADLLLVSEPAGLANLAREGIAPAKIQYVGNVMIDTLVDQLAAARALAMPAQLGVTPGRYAVVTLHRPVNVDDHARLAACVRLVCELATDLDVVFPIHPRTGAQLAAAGLRAHLDGMPRVRAVPPLGYREFIGLVERARLVVTDSGGIQEETTYLGIPCITLRTTTERPVTITRGTNELVGEDLALAAQRIAAVLAGGGKQASPIDGWDGRAAERAVAAISRLCGVTSS